MNPFQVLKLKELGQNNVLLEEGAAPRARYTPPSLVPEAPKKDAQPLPPAFTEADIKAAEQAGYRKGFLEGTKEGEQQARSMALEVEKQLTETLKTVTEPLQALLAEYHRFAEAQRALLPRAALSIARKVAGEALREAPMLVVETMAMRCLTRLLGEPNITVTVHSSLAPMLEEKLITHFAGNTDPGEIHIQASDAIAPQDCRIEWSQGSAERITDTLWQEIEQLITTHTPPIQPNPGA